MLPFNLDDVRNGAAVCTRSGIPVTILATDLMSVSPVVAVLHNRGGEDEFDSVLTYKANGYLESPFTTSLDLMIDDKHADDKKDALD